MLSDIILSVIMLSDISESVIMLNVIMLSVVVPKNLSDNFSNGQRYELKR
jgi:hypothetical protein